MECFNIEFNDLADELLLIIFKNIDNVDVLYSLYGINKRFNKIIRDSIFTSNLSFVKWYANNFLNKFSPNIVINRFCLQILPDISVKIEWFHLEESSAKNILRAADYPNLYGLGLYNMNLQRARRLFAGKNTLKRTLF
jgi:hypothetical protein